MRQEKYISNRDIEIIQMREDGKSYKQISKETGIREDALWHIFFNHGIVIKKPQKRCSDCGVRVNKRNKPATRSNRCKKCFNIYHQRFWKDKD
jgi:hypothetical protein